MKENTFVLPRRAFIAGAAATGALALTHPSLVFADEVSDKQAEADAALSSLNAMQTALNEASDNYTQALNEQQEAQQAMNDAQTQIDETNEVISGNQVKLSSRVRRMYRTGSSTFLDVLAGASTFEDFATGLDLLNEMSEDDAKLVSDLKTQRTTLENAKAEYAIQEQTAAKKAEEAASVQAEAEATVAQYQACLLYTSPSPRDCS